MAQRRHKRETNARRFNPFQARAVTIAGPLAVLATTSVVSLGVMGADVSDPTGFIARPAGGDPTSSARDLARGTRDATVSRGSSRAKLFDSAPGKPPEVSKVDALLTDKSVANAIKGADSKLWTTDALNLWTEPGEKADQTGEVEAGRRVLLTGRSLYGRDEMVWHDDETRWVTAGYFSEEKPVSAGAGLSMDPCSDPGVESGLSANAVFVYRSVCNAFPQITTYGGYDAHGEHASGRALDIMTSDIALGTAIADFLRAHSAELHLYDVIWRQRIWTPVRSAEGWRYMPSRGSATADHYDHVHVSTY